MTKHPKVTLQGFTLIEAMVVVVIVAILASIAYPTYLDQVRKSKRAVAKSALLDAANRQELYYFTNRQYVANLITLNYPTNPAYFGDDNTPLGSSAGAVYKLSASTVKTDCGDTPCFILTATPQGDQVNDKCGAFTLTSRNQRAVSNSTSTPAGDCW